MSARLCDCGYPLLAPQSKARGYCARCALNRDKYDGAYTMTDVEQRRAEQNSNSGGRA